MSSTKEPKITTLVKLIRKAHADCCAAIGQALNHAFTAGQHLYTCREQLKTSGGGSYTKKWERWVQAQCGFSVATANNYIRLWLNRELLDPAKLPEMSYNAAMRAIRVARTNKPKKSPRMSEWEEQVATLAKSHHIRGKIHHLLDFLEEFGVTEKTRCLNEPSGIP